MHSISLKVDGLSKYFGKLCVINKISLKIYEGETFGLLGINGAGKTTLIKCILKLLNTAGGEILYKEKPLTLNDIYKRFGYLPENFLPPAELTGGEFLRTLSLSLHIPYDNVISILKKVELDSKKRIKNYSRGMIQRLGLATALLKNPEFIILDEPALGLDPVGQSKILTLLEGLNKQGKTIFFSSHNLIHIEKICIRIGILHHGKIKFTGTVKGLLDEQNSNSLEQSFLKILGCLKPSL